MKTKSTGIGSVSDIQTAAAPAVAFGFRFDESDFIASSGVCPANRRAFAV
jgi:hypothetical protein